MEHWSTNEEIGRQWIAGVELFTTAAAEQIERHRKAGLAPGGPDARRLAAALVWGTQHCLYAAGLGVDGDLDRRAGGVRAADDDVDARDLRRRLSWPAGAWYGRSPKCLGRSCGRGTASSPLRNWGSGAPR